MTFDTEYLTKEDGRYIILYTFDNDEPGEEPNEEEPEA